MRLGPNFHRWLRIGLTAALLVQLTRIISLGEISRAVMGAAPGLVAVALGMAVFERLVASRRLKVLTDVQDMGFDLRGLFEIALLTNLFTFLLPGALAGGPVRWYQLSRKEGSGGRALAVLLFDRYVDTLVVVAGGVAAWALTRGAQTHPAIATTMALIAAGLLLGFAALLAIDVVPLLARLPGPAGPREKLTSWVTLANRCAHQPASRHAAIIALSLVKDATGAAAVWVLARAVGFEISLAMAWWVRAVGLTVTLLPISVAGLGVRELALVILLAPLGVANADAVALSLLMFLRSVFLALVGGGVLLARGGATEPANAGAEARP